MKSPVRLHNNVRPKEPYRLVGPPERLAPGWVKSEPTPIGHPLAIKNTPIETRKIDLNVIKELMDGCDYRGPSAVSCGCSKKWFCLRGEGRMTEQCDLPIVTKSDCWACVTNTIAIKNPGTQS